jgi:hypothetical protein
LIDTPLVHPHFARAQDAVNMAFRYTFADTQQVVVDALTGFFFSDGDELLRRWTEFLSKSFILNI